MRLRQLWTDGALKHLSFERLPGHYGESTLVTWHDKTFVLDKGSGDWWVPARDLDDPDALYILSGSYNQGYIGLEYIHPEYHMGPHPSKREYLSPMSVFFQDPDDAWSGDPQPKPWSEYAWHTQIRRLAERLPWH